MDIERLNEVLDSSAPGGEEVRDLLQQELERYFNKCPEALLEPDCDIASLKAGTGPEISVSIYRLCIHTRKIELTVNFGYPSMKSHNLAAISKAVEIDRDGRGVTVYR